MSLPPLPVTCDAHKTISTHPEATQRQRQADRGVCFITSIPRLEATLADALLQACNGKKTNTKTKAKTKTKKKPTSDHTTGHHASTLHRSLS